MKLVSVNIGSKGTVEHPDKTVITGIFKRPVTGPVRIGGLGLEGDFIGSAKHHGGPDQAVYIYGTTDYDWWSRELGRTMEPGIFGENLTIGGLESAPVCIGDQFLVGSAVLQVTAPRIPCVTLAARMGDPAFVKRFRQAERPGLYCRVLQPGGHLALLVPAMPALYGSLDENLRHYRRYDKGALATLVARAGFAVESVRYLNRPGVLGWWLNSRVLKRRVLPKRQLGAFKWIMPLVKTEEKTEPSFGMSLLVLARKP